LHTNLSAILGERSIGKLSNLLSVHLSRTTVILCIGVIGGAAMLAEKPHLCTNKSLQYWLMQIAELRGNGLKEEQMQYIMHIIG